MFWELSGDREQELINVPFATLHSVDVPAKWEVDKEYQVDDEVVFEQDGLPRSNIPTIGSRGILTGNRHNPTTSCWNPVPRRSSDFADPIGSNRVFSTWEIWKIFLVSPRPAVKEDGEKIAIPCSNLFNSRLFQVIQRFCKISFICSDVCRSRAKKRCSQSSLVVVVVVSLVSSIRSIRFAREQTSEEDFHLNCFPDICGCQQHLQKKHSGKFSIDKTKEWLINPFLPLNFPFTVRVNLFSTCIDEEICKRISSSSASLSLSLVDCSTRDWSEVVFVLQWLIRRNAWIGVEQVGESVVPCSPGTQTLRCRHGINNNALELLFGQIHRDEDYSREDVHLMRRQSKRPVRTTNWDSRSSNSFSNWTLFSKGKYREKTKLWETLDKMLRFRWLFLNALQSINIIRLLILQMFDLWDRWEWAACSCVPLWLWSHRFDVLSFSFAKWALVYILWRVFGGRQKRREKPKDWFGSNTNRCRSRMLFLIGLTEWKDVFCSSSPLLSFRANGVNSGLFSFEFSLPNENVSFDQWN